MEAGTDVSPLPVGLWLPLFDELSDRRSAHVWPPRPEAGWHGFFVWDQLRWEAPVRRVADLWITLASCGGDRTAASRPHGHTAATTPTGQGRPRDRDLGPAQRRPPHSASESAKTGSLAALEDRRAAQRQGPGPDARRGTDTTAWSGEPVHHHGDHTRSTTSSSATAGAATRRPGRIAGFPGNTRPMRRAARYDGFFPVNPSTPDQSSPEVVARSQPCDRIRRQRTTSSSVSRWDAVRSLSSTARS
jgi:hypothetical protein